MKSSTKKLFLKFFNKHKDLYKFRKTILNIVELFKRNYLNGGKILICGNGGSAADSEHFVGELMKGFILNRPISSNLLKKLKFFYPDDYNDFKNNLQVGIPSISLVSQSSLISAFNNDKNSNFVYSQQVFAYAKKFDSLVCISTSGNSKNVVNAAKIAKVLGIHVISLTGMNGGQLKDVSDYLVNVPSEVTSDIQEIHLPIYHLICLALENELFS